MCFVCWVMLSANALAEYKCFLETHWAANSSYDRSDNFKLYMYPHNQNCLRKWSFVASSAMDWTSGSLVSSDENMVTEIHIRYNYCDAAVVSSVSRAFRFFEGGAKGNAILWKFKACPWWFRTLNYTYRKMEGIYSGDRSDEYPVPLVIPTAKVGQNQVIDDGVIRLQIGSAVFYIYP